jgi:hypothetical protein
MNFSDYFQSQLEVCIRDFEASLLAWMKDHNDTDAVEHIERTMTRLTMMERREAFRRLWWLGSGMAEMVRSTETGSEPLIKHLFARILRELKKQRPQNGSTRANTPPEDLIDDIMTALKQPDTDQYGPIMFNIAREFSLNGSSVSH